MKILSTVALFVLIPQCFGLKNADFDEAYGHIRPSCEDQDNDTPITLAELVSQTNTGPVIVDCGYRATAEQGLRYEIPDGLEVYGELVFEDASSNKETIVEAPYVLVRGYLQAGTLDNPFQSKLRFILTEFQNEPENHFNLTVDSLSENEYFKGSMNFGDKAFVVYGGTVSLCGPPEKEKIYAKLAKSVQSDNVVIVQGDWTDYWKPGHHLVITGSRKYTEFGEGDAQEVTLSSLKKIKNGKQTRLTLSEDLDRPEDVTAVKIKSKNFKGKKKNVLITAEVYKLTRNIVVQGIPRLEDMTDFIGTRYTVLKQEPRGGHFVVAHTPNKQVIQSVEFAAMGQPGIIGRYPIHFHSCGNIDSETILRYNSVHHSKQRCVVVHATNDLTITKNAAFWADDHCFMVEDNRETRNTFSHNIASNIRRAGFWMSNPSNDLIKNTVSNSHAGYEYAETGGDFSKAKNIPCQDLGNFPDKDMISGPLPNVNGCTIPRVIPMGKFKGNVVHNCVAGMFIYPPRSVRDPNKPDKIIKFFAWNVNTAIDGLWDNAMVINSRFYGTERAVILNGGNNIIVDKSVFQEVCEGVIEEADIVWRRQHSGVIVKRSVFEETYEKRDSCAPFTIYGYGGQHNHYWMHVSAQLRDLKLYKVNNLFSTRFFDCTSGRVCQYGFFVYNIQSFESPMSDIALKSGFDNDSYTPSYVTWYGYPTNYFGKQQYDGLLKDCEKSKIGGNPVNDQFYFCEGQCWRPIAILYERVLGDDKPVSVKFVSETGEEFVLNEIENIFRPCKSEYGHILQLLPVGMYNVALVDNEMNELDGEIRLYHTDQEYGGFNYKLGCTEDVVIKRDGQKLSVSNFEECRPYYL